MDFFYDAQIRRYLVQFMRIFSEIKHRAGPDANGNYSVERVPIMYGDPSLIVAQTIKGASANTLLPTPMFSAYITDIKHSSERRASPQLQDTVSILEREFVNGDYTSEQGNWVDVKRYMPVPYDITMQLDIWTTNVNTKLQLLEQILSIFNPSLQLQQTSSPVDWTSIFEVFIENTTWTNRSIPMGTEEEKDIASLTFKVQVWINPPAIVKRTALIAQVVSNVHNIQNIEEYSEKLGDLGDIFSDLGSSTQIITTVGGHCIRVYRGDNGDDYIKLLDKYQNDTTVSWASLFQEYGKIVSNITRIRIKLDNDIDSTEGDIFGYIDQTSDPRVLSLRLDNDTLPGQTIGPIASIIDPTEVWPGNCLPNKRAGQRYLIVSQNSDGEEVAIPMNVPNSPWGVDIPEVYPNDIIEYDGNKWKVVFDSRLATFKDETVNVVNISDNTYYTFSDGTWSFTYYGIFTGGYWRVDNLQRL